jgi:hypothetical protein
MQHDVGSTRIGVDGVGRHRSLYEATSRPDHGGVEIVERR